MSQLSGLLTMVPLTITPDVVNEYLAKRKSQRQEAASKSGTTANPHVVAPVSGEWQGICKECRASGKGQQIAYRLSFKACGAIEGSATSAEGKFLVKGVYNVIKGTVQWRQSSPHAASSSQYGTKGSAEFVGDLIPANLPSKQGAIVGTFLTTSGGYYNVELWDPVAAVQPQCVKAPLPLPTLLTGGCTPKGCGTPARFYSKNSDAAYAPKSDSAPQEKMRFALAEFMDTVDTVS